MIIKEIGVSKGLTISIGKYESIRIDTHLLINIEEGEDTDIIFQAGYEMCDEQLNKQIESVQSIIGETSLFKVDKTINKPKKSNRRRAK